MMNKLFYILLGVTVTSMTACQGRTPTPQSTTANAPQSQSSDTKNSDTTPRQASYAARGIVVELVPDDRGAFIHHEAIPGFMEEMTMYLKVAEREEYQDLKVGHQYNFEMLVDQEDETRIHKLVPTGKVAPQDSAATKPSERWLEPPAFELGDKVPEFVFTSSTGETISPAALRGNVWAITFIFTRCPLPDYCPRMTLRFKETMEILKQKQVDHWKLISLTMDPEYDGLEILKNYRQMWEVDSDVWHFCRAEPEQVKAIGDPLGLSFQSDKFPIEHNLRTAVFDSQGRLVEVFSGNQWTAAELAESMIRAMKSCSE